MHKCKAYHCGAALLLLRLHAVADIIQEGVVNRFPNIFNGFLWIQWRHDLILPGAYFVRGEHANFTVNESSSLFVTSLMLCDVFYLSKHVQLNAPSYRLATFSL